MQLVPKTAISNSSYQYCIDNGIREHAELINLHQITMALPDNHMMISKEQGALMALIAKLINAHSYLEIGVFTGYSTLWLALALPENGRITALDISNEHAAIAKNAWQKARVIDKIDYKIQPALTSLQELIAQKKAYDLAFIDANKSQYIDYYENTLQLLKPGGLLMIDNVLMNGQVLEENPQKTYVKTIKQLNELIKNDERVDICMLPIGDGVTLARKR